MAGVPESEKAKIETLAREHGLMESVTAQRENSMACVAFPTCPLAMAEAERFLPAFVTRVEETMTRHGVGDEHIVLRVTGCPNGCGRALLAEVGLVGKARAVTTCIWAVTAPAPVFRACTVRTSPKTRF